MRGVATPQNKSRVARFCEFYKEWIGQLSVANNMIGAYLEGYEKRPNLVNARKIKTVFRHGTHLYSEMLQDYAICAGYNDLKDYILGFKDEEEEVLTGFTADQLNHAGGMGMRIYRPFAANLETLFKDLRGKGLDISVVKCYSFHRKRYHNCRKHSLGRAIDITLADKNGAYDGYELICELAKKHQMVIDIFKTRDCIHIGYRKTGINCADLSLATIDH